MSTPGRYWYKQLSETHHGLPIYLITNPDGKGSGKQVIGEVSVNHLVHDLNNMADRIKQLEDQLATANKNGARWKAFQNLFKMDYVRHHVLSDIDLRFMRELERPNRNETGLDVLMDWCIEHGKTPTTLHFEKEDQA